jgi:glycosyltransferase involved in cell wall biosynthesis
VISVVIPVGPGRDENLMRVLHSLSLQTYRNFEVVVATNAKDMDWLGVN